MAPSGREDASEQIADLRKKKTVRGMHLWKIEYGMN